MFSSKVGTIAENLNAKAFNLHLALEQRNLKNQSLNLVKEQDVSNIIQGWFADLTSLNENRLLFGYPRTLSQIHTLRKFKIYPNKVFIINCDEQAARTRVCKKLFGTESPETLEEEKQINNIFQEYCK